MRFELGRFLFGSQSICLPLFRVGVSVVSVPHRTERTEYRKTHILGTENWIEKHVSVPVQVRFSVPIQVFGFYPIGPPNFSKNT